MKWLSFLRTLTKIIFVLSIIFMAYLIPILFVMIFAKDIVPEDIIYIISNESTGSIGVEEYLYATAIILSLGFYIYALYLFKKVLAYFHKREVFHENVVRYFNQSGKAVLNGYMIELFAVILYNFLVKQQTSVSTDFIMYSFLIVGVGLFFIVLSEVFLMAKNLKEDNDLTI
ncbi:DUF2975 domain-containing protein [Flavobacterium sp. MK4S-17]|uniref:DUF2975 domain-containing protein n=1 Tax=Flavobacterium sp. MK4S-17 TaxID=2543737 RepID=UPI001358C83B|nr:DUF2975 domain-containing protein [Flavobacterium sp. MK4S-17]